MEETEERSETDTDTDVESTQSRQKKGQMKSVFCKVTSEGRECQCLPRSKSPLRPSAATASVLDTSQETESEMEISMAFDVTHQPSTTGPSHQPADVTITTA